MDKKNYILFGLAFIILLTSLYLYQWNIKKMEDYTQWVTHTQEVIFRFEKLASDVKSVRIFPANIRKNHRNNIPDYEDTEAQGIPGDLNDLRFLISDNPRQVKRIDTLTTLISQHLSWMSGNNPSDSAAANNTAGLTPLIMIQYHIDKGIAMEKQLLSERKASLVSSRRTTSILRVIFMITGLLIIIIIALSNFYQISRRNALESFLASVLNTSQTGIIACEAIRERQKITDFKILFVNDSLEKQLELKEGEVMKKTLLGISPTAIETGMFDRYQRVTATGNKEEFETCREKEGFTRWYQVNVSKLNDGFMASYSEITELKHSQQQLQKKVEELQRTNSELEQFAYVASHDLQEPLRKIETFSGLIIERFNEPSASFAKVYLNKVILAANRMSGLINDLLNLSSLSDQSQLFVETDLNAILNTICNDFELIIQEKNAVINCGYLHATEAIALQMSQLFYNLLNNALKFSRPDVPPEISITASLLTKEQTAGYQLDPSLSYQEIQVKDNGIGFNQDYAQKIFVIFQRLNNRQSFAGTGIGLALCKKIIQNHNGIIHAESQENQGACFRIVLPLRQPVSLTGKKRDALTAKS